jgi:ATP-binding cassette subfamily B protein
MLVNEAKIALESQQPDIAGVLEWLVLAAAMILVGNTSNIAGEYCRFRLGDELRLAISKQSFEHATALDQAFFEDPSSHDILSRATQNPGGDFLLFVVDAIGTFELAIQIGSLLAVLAWIDPLTTPLLFLLAVPWFLFRWYIAKIRFVTLRSNTTKQRWTLYYMGQLITREAIPTIKLFGLGPLLLRRLEENFRQIMDIDRLIQQKQAIGGMIAALVFTVGFLMVISLVGYRSLAGVIPFQFLISYLLASFRLRNSVVEFINRLSSSMEKVLSITNLQEFLKSEPSVQDKGSVSGPVRGKIELRGVSFAYPGTEVPVLRKVSMRIHPGETIALVGPNGGGKTTLVKLLVRLYDVSDGSILIDGTNITELKLESFQSQIAYVDQQTVRFEATVHENIAYGDWQHLIDNPDEVRKIAEKAGITNLVQKMPSGMETRLGRLFGQFDLSGGQWQKISIARALARNASIYILDEPTAHLDAQSEFEIFSSLRDLFQNKTAILISHRFTTARMADRIFVIDEGRVVQEGTHDELCQKGGLYKELYRLHQLSFLAQQPGE